jgi:ATP-dependent Clp protease protease subunit
MGYGQCMSAGSFLLAAGTKGKRFALPNADIMIHELAGGTSGKFNDMKNDYKKMERLHEKMANHYVEFTGQDIERVKKDMERDHFLTAEEAKEYGLIDEIQYHRE